MISCNNFSSSSLVNFLEVFLIWLLWFWKVIFYSFEHLIFRYWQFSFASSGSCIIVWAIVHDLCKLWSERCFGLFCIQIDTCVKYEFQRIIVLCSIYFTSTFHAFVNDISLMWGLREFGRFNVRIIEWSIDITCVVITKIGIIVKIFWII